MGQTPRPGGSAAPYYGVNSSFTSKTDARHFDYTVGERGDILMFTREMPLGPSSAALARRNGNPQTIQSDVAEVSLVLRGNRLHRRVLLIVPGAALAVASYQ